MDINNNSELKTIQGNIFVIYTILNLMIYILPSLKILVPYLIAAGIMLIFLPFVFFKMQRYTSYYILIFFAAFFVSLVNVINGLYTSYDFMNEIIRTLRFFMPVIWTLFALRFCSSKQQNIILLAFAVITVFILIKTILALETDAWIARILAQSKTSDNAQIRSYRMDNVGGFEFSYMIGIVVICLTWAALKCKRILIKVICIASAFFCYYYIIQTMYTTLLLLTSMGILLLLFFNAKSIIYKISFIAVGLVLAFSAAPLFKFLSGLFTNSLLSTKFLQIYNVLSGKGLDSLGSRPGFIANAVGNWLKSPIWGGYSTSTHTHSFIFSILERTGIIGLTAFLSCMYVSYKVITVQLKEKSIDTLLTTMVFAYIIALSVFNPIDYLFEIPIAAFFIAPVWSQFILKNNDIKPKADKLKHNIQK